MPSAMPSARHVCSNLRVVVLQRPLFVFLGIVHIAPFLLHPRIFNGERAYLRMAGISSLLNLLLQFLELTLKMCVSMLNLYLSISPSGK